jgi:hypothetical protein
MTDREKNVLNLGKGYLSLLYLKCQYEISGKEAPVDLVNGIKIIEQQIRHITKTQK